MIRVNSLNLLFVIIALSYGCSFSTTIIVPKNEDVSEIKLSIEPELCCIDRYRIADKESIAQILKAYRSLQNGWKTSQYLAYTRGMFTTPTFPNRAVFLNQEGQAIHVLWFSNGLIGAREIPNNKESDAYRKPSEELISAILNARRESVPTEFDKIK